MDTTYTSDRGLPLTMTTDARDLYRPILAVEDYCKWYCLYLIEPHGGDVSIHRVEFYELGGFVSPERDGSAYVDHVPNPFAVMRFASANGFNICDAALERIVGRWELEVKHDYDDAINELP